jgi:hypothetical protein
MRSLPLVLPPNLGGAFLLLALMGVRVFTTLSVVTMAPRRLTSDSTYCIQRNQRVRGLKHGALTSDRWIGPGKWACCRVAVGGAYLYGKEGWPATLERVFRDN